MLFLMMKSVDFHMSVPYTRYILKHACSGSDKKASCARAMNSEYPCRLHTLKIPQYGNLKRVGQICHLHGKTVN